MAVRGIVVSLDQFEQRPQGCDGAEVGVAEPQSEYLLGQLHLLERSPRLVASLLGGVAFRLKQGAEFGAVRSAEDAIDRPTEFGLRVTLFLAEANLF